MPCLDRHLNIGAGRIVWQDIVRIDVSIKKRQFHKSKNIVDSFNRAKEGNGRLHLLGLVSDLCYLCAGVSRQDNAVDLFICLCGSLVDLMGISFIASKRCSFTQTEFGNIANFL
jgi:hypothetical protein